MSIFDSLSNSAYFEADVTEPTQSYSGFTVYRVVLQLVDNGSLQDEIVTWKRYSDFRKLHNQLKLIYCALNKKHASFPLFAKRKILGRYASNVIEDRRQSSLKLLQFSLLDRDLLKQDILKSFFEQHGTHRTLSVTSSLSLSLDDSEADRSGSCIPSTPPGSGDNMTHLDPPGGESVWSYRQPTPDTLEVDDPICEDAPVSTLSSQLDEFILADSASDAVEDADLPEFVAVPASSEPVPASSEAVLRSIRTIDSPPDDAARECTSSDSGSDAEVFDENGCEIHRGAWLRHAMSVCSEGEDLEQLASEGEGITLGSPEISPRPSIVDDYHANTESCAPSDRPMSPAAVGSVANGSVTPVNGVAAGEPPGDHCNGTPDLFTLDERLSSIIQDTIQQEDYVYHASVAMSDAIEHEVKGDFKSAFEAYKFGIGILLHGVQQDSNHERREAVRRKTASYLLRAENVYNIHKHSQVASIKTSYSSPTSTHITNLPQSLHDMKVLGILDKVILVRCSQGDGIFVVKVLHKNATLYKQRDKGSLTPRHGKSKLLNCKYMVKILSYSETSCGVYLMLQHVQPGRLWDHIGMDTKWTSSTSAVRFPDDSGAVTTSQGSNKQGGTPLIADENKVRCWAAEMFTCVFNLHKEGILCRDLNPRNVLIDQHGHILLTHFSNIKGIDYAIDEQAVERLYAAPEVGGTFEVGEPADYWSVGALLFELLTGQALHDCHPAGIHSHSIITLPRVVSGEAHSLLKELLRYQPSDRLGSGRAGIEEVKCHPFFRAVDWNAL